MAKKVRVVMPSAGPTPYNNYSNQAETQKYNKSQIFLAGYTRGVSANATTTINDITLPGSARRLYGITIILPTAVAGEDDTLTLSINNESILTQDGVNYKNFSPAFNFKIGQYFEIPRPLEGSDTIQIKWAAGTQKNVYITFFLSASRDK